MDLGARLRGRHVLVTGASAGLGEHFARLAARCGAVVTVAARRRDRLETLVRELRDYHWRNQDEGGWDYDFTRRFQDVESRIVDAGATAARFDFPVEWGEYRVDVLDPEVELVHVSVVR